MKTHKVWKLAKQRLGWDGGTIHQISRAVDCPEILLLSRKGDKCDVFINGAWTSGSFISLDDMPLAGPDTETRYASFSAFVSGFNNSGALSGLRGGTNIRTHHRF